MLLIIICVALGIGAMAFGWYDSQNTEKFRFLKIVLKPILKWVGWKEEVGCGLVYNQPILVRPVVALLIGLILFLLCLWKVGFSGENALVALPPFEVLLWGSVSVFAGLITSYLWPELKGKAEKIGKEVKDEAKNAMKRAVEGAYGTYEHDSSGKQPEVKPKAEEPVKKEEPPVEVKKEEEPVDPRKAIDDFTHRRNKGGNS